MNPTTQQERLAALPNGTRICWSSCGRTDAPAVVLIAGLGLQWVYWPAALVDGLASSGLRVICFDNRDAGRSSRSTTPQPSQLDLLLGRAPATCYALEDMAEDTALLMQHLGLAQAHVVGMSMGGMIAQALACRHPKRVASLVSIFSTTGHRRVGQPAPSTLLGMALARRPRSRQEALERFARVMTHIGDPTAPGALAEWSRYAALAWERNGERADAKAFNRQIAAIFKSGDRTAQLAAIRVPTLVVHGDVDRMVAPSGGVATARAIPGARHEVLAGMRHQIDTWQSTRLLPLLIEHFQKAAPIGAKAGS